MLLITQKGLLIVQQAGIVYGSPFRSYQAQSGLLGWAWAQEQAESGRGLWKGPSQCQGGKAPSGFGFQRLGSQCLKRACPSGIKGGTQAEPQKGQAEGLVQD